MKATDEIDAAYARGTQAFMGLELLCAPGALVPREETELLGARAVDLVAGLAREEAAPATETAEAGDAHGAWRATVIDMCCGSGNLACAIASRVPRVRVWASDLTNETVALARRNVDRLGLGARVRVVQGDLFAGLEGEDLVGAVDLIVCNPPYISSGKLEKDSAFLLEREPRAAFDGGPYGLSIHQRVIKEALPFLKSGGFVLFEMGAGQQKQLQILFDRSRAYSSVEFACNAAGEPRVAIAKRK